VENIATDFFSAYHRYQPNQPVNAAYLRVQAAHQADPVSHEPFMRQPSLADRRWWRQIRDRLRQVARRQSAYHPLFYNLADEAGIADLAAYWDFDFSPSSLAGFRAWLRVRYGTIGTLNRQWGSGFASWNQVMPLTAVEAVRRADGNYAAWADFREWMDVSFFRALKMARDAVHSVAPKAIATIEGGQAPGTGGYDYSLLSRALDGFELYDAGGNIDMIRSFSPHAVLLTTSFEGGPAEKRRVWREVLRGGRGLILWDDGADYVAADAALGTRGREAAGYYNEIRNGVGALLINSRPWPTGIAIHYSPASQRIAWILAEKAKGEAGIEAATAADHPPDDMTLSRDSLCRTLANRGYQYRFVASRQVEEGTLRTGGIHTLVLAGSIALSSVEAAEIRRFVRHGGLVIADGEPGVFDTHGRRLTMPRLSDWFPSGKPSTPVGIGRGRAVPMEGADFQSIADVLQRNGVEPTFPVTDPRGGGVPEVEVHALRNGAVTLLGLLSGATTAQSRVVTLTLPSAGFVYDLRSGNALGRGRRFSVPLEPDEPTILAVSPRPLAAPRLSVPHHLHPGDIGRIRVHATPSRREGTRIFHVAIYDPTGTLRPAYSGNLLSHDGRATMVLPMAANDPAGVWRVKATDVISGQSIFGRLVISPSE
jgi:hypothetical protein